MDILGGRSCCVAHLSHWTGPMGPHEGWPEKVGNKDLRMLENIQRVNLHYSRFQAIIYLMFSSHFSDQLLDGPGRKKIQKDSLEALGQLYFQHIVKCSVVFFINWSILPIFVGPVQKGTLWSFCQDKPLTLWMLSTPRTRPGSQRRFVSPYLTY